MSKIIIVSLIILCGCTIHEDGIKELSNRYAESRLRSGSRAYNSTLLRSRSIDYQEYCDNLKRYKALKPSKKRAISIGNLYINNYGQIRYDIATISHDSVPLQGSSDWDIRAIARVSANGNTKLGFEIENIEVLSKINRDGETSIWITWTIRW